MAIETQRLLAEQKALLSLKDTKSVGLRLAVLEALGALGVPSPEVDMALLAALWPAMFGKIGTGLIPATPWQGTHIALARSPSCTSPTTGVMRRTSWIRPPDDPTSRTGSCAPTPGPRPATPISRTPRRTTMPPMREDVISDGNIRDQVLANAPKSEDGFFVVPKVVE